MAVGAKQGIDPEEVADDEDYDERDEKRQKNPAMLGAPAHGNGQRRPEACL